MPRPSTLIAAGTSLATCALYLVGSDRAFDHDGVITMDQFVRTSSLADPFTRQAVFNNHPLFSFLDHLVFSATRSADEVTMRILPVAFAGAAVGVMGWWASERWGAASGVAAAIAIGSNPLLTSTGREVRGYSLLVLVVALLGTVVHRDPRLTGRLAAWAAALIAMGVATHLYMVAPLTAMLLWVHARGAWNDRWRSALLAGSAIGVLPYLGMVSQFGRAGRMFRPTFPLLWELLGAKALSLFALGLLMVWAILTSSRPTKLDRATCTVAIAISGMVAAAWLLAPTDLYPRFFVWLLPLLGAIVGRAVDGKASRLVLVALASAASLSVQLPTWASDELANRDIARSLSQRSQSEVCGLGATEAYRFYAPNVVDPPVDHLESCDVIVLLLPSQLDDAPSVKVLLNKQFPVECDYADSLVDGVVRLRAGMGCPS